MRNVIRSTVPFAALVFLACSPTPPGGDGGGDPVGTDDAGGHALDDAGEGPHDGGQDAGQDAGHDAGQDAGSCPEGYAGEGCADCADGYQDEDDDGECLPSCEATGELALECGPYGACVVEEGARICACDQGYTGETCSTCAPGFEIGDGECVLGGPPEGAWMWLDADDTTSVTLAGNGGFATTFVERWTDKRGGLVAPYFEALTEANQPRTQPNTLNGRRTIAFDGVDDYLVRSGGVLQPGSGPFQNVAEYTILLVGFARGGGQTFLAGTVQNSHGLLLESYAEDELHFLHRTPISNVSQPDEDDLVSTLGGYSRESAQLIGAMRTSALQGISRGVGDAFLEVQAVSADAFPEALTFMLGRATVSGNPGRYLDGAIAELLIYQRALSAEEVAQAQGYLAAKWGLE